MEISEAYLLELHMVEARKFPRLNEEEERELCRLRDEGTPEERIWARNKMTEHHLRLAVKIAHGYTNKGLPLGDLVSLGYMGLIHAVELFNPDMGKFSSYASWWIKREIFEGFRKSSRAV